MASRSDIEAGKAHVTLWLKKDQLMAGLKSVQQIVGQTGAQLMRVGATVAAVGTSILAAGTAAAAAFGNAGNSLYKLSNRTGLAVAALSELHYAAQQSGVALEAVDAALGVMIDKRLNPERFDEIAASIAGISDRALQAATATQYWGSTGAQLIPMLNNLKAHRQQARDLGIAPSPQQVTLAAELVAVWAKLRAVVDAVVFQVGAALAPVIVDVLDSVIKIAAATAKWVRENGELVRLIAGVGVALTVVGTIVLGIGAGLVTVASLCAGITGLIALTLNPIGAVVVAIVAAGTAITAAVAGWLIFTRAGRATAKAVFDAFSVLFNYIGKSLRGIANAVLAGDFDLAWQILAQSFKTWMTAAINDVFILLIEQIINVSTLLEDQMSAWGKAMFGGNLANLRTELEALRDATAESTRLDFELLDQAINRAGNAAGKSDSLSSGGGFEAMKSLGSFNPYAITLQNWGKGDGPEKKQLDKLQQIYDSNVRGHAATKQAIESCMTYGD